MRAAASDRTSPWRATALGPYIAWITRRMALFDVTKRRCDHESCSMNPIFGVKSSQIPLCCKQHAENVMVDVKNRRCGREDCSK